MRQSFQHVEGAKSLFEIKRSHMTSLNNCWEHVFTCDRLLMWLPIVLLILMTSVMINGMLVGGESCRWIVWAVWWPEGLFFFRVCCSVIEVISAAGYMVALSCFWVTEIRGESWSAIDHVTLARAAVVMKPVRTTVSLHHTRRLPSCYQKWGWVFDSFSPIFQLSLWHIEHCYTVLCFS